MALNRTMTTASLLLILANCADSGMKTSTPDYTRGKYVYNAFCAECHDSGAGGAPMLDDPEDWESRTLELPSLLTDHATKGFLGMPEKGAHSDLSDGAVQDAVHYMIRQIASEE